ncbi:MAG: alpha/beta hydrolase family protein [Armatimonadota bacterium]
MPYHDYAALVEEYYIRRVRETYHTRQERLTAIQTREDAQAYMKQVQQAISCTFGPLPAKTPLNPVVTRTTNYHDYLVDHVLFESRPGFMVSANLYLPVNRATKVPGVLFPCGHSPEGKAYPSYVKASIRLVREGYAVLNYDPINQGERGLYTQLGIADLPTRIDPWLGHNIIGRQMSAYGDWLGTWWLWDAMRGVDYLVSRPEVDHRCLGVAGQSGGATTSAFLWAMDRRLRMIASSCWVTSYLSDLENLLPGDAEQYPPGFLAAGLDKIDFFMARAGEPALLLGEEDDFFDNRGLHQAYDELLRIHRLLGGTDEHCRLAMDTQCHGFSDRNQVAMLDFFNRVTENPSPAPDTSLTLPDERSLQVTKACDVQQCGSRPIYTLIAEAAQHITEERGPIDSEQLPDNIRRALHMRTPTHVPHHRRLCMTRDQRVCTTQQVFRFVIESKPGILIVLRHVCHDGNPFRMKPDPCVHLYLPNISSQADLDHADTMAGMDDFWALDVRGLGEGMHSAADVRAICGCEYMVTEYAVLYHETLLGDRLFDVLNAVNLLRAEGANEIHLYGHRQGAILALLTAILDPGIASVASWEAPESFLAMACSPFTNWPAVNFPRGVLRYFDLPDVRRTLEARLVVDSLCSPTYFD